jgi:hypothetical protein
LDIDILQKRGKSIAARAKMYEANEKMNGILDEASDALKKYKQ